MIDKFKESIKVKVNEEIENVNKEIKEKIEQINNKKL